MVIDEGRVSLGGTPESAALRRDGDPGIRHDGVSLNPENPAAGDAVSEPASATSANLPPPSPVDDGPPPVQFSLKSLLVLTSLLGAAFAVVSRLSLLGAVAMAWLLLLMAAHVSGNAWGSRATAFSPRRHRRSSEASSERGGPLACAPQTHLGSQGALGLSMAVMVAVGAVIGAVVGLGLIWWHNHGGLGPTEIALGLFSSAVIGAFLTFLTCSCLKVASKAFRQASDSAGKQGNTRA
jgi:hypothetical protein